MSGWCIKVCCCCSICPCFWIKIRLIIISYFFYIKYFTQYSNFRSKCSRFTHDVKKILNMKQYERAWIWKNKIKTLKMFSIMFCHGTCELERSLLESLMSQLAWASGIKQWESSSTTMDIKALQRHKYGEISSCFLSIYVLINNLIARQKASHYVDV